MEKEFKIIGNRIKMLRLQAGIMQTTMAKAIGMSQTNLSNVESGRTATTIQVLLKIREVLGCKMSDFFVDLDPVVEVVVESKEVEVSKNAIELEDAVNVLKLLKAVEIKGL